LGVHSWHEKYQGKGGKGISQSQQERTHPDPIFLILLYIVSYVIELGSVSSPKAFNFCTNRACPFNIWAILGVVIGFFPKSSGLKSCFPLKKWCNPGEYTIFRQTHISYLG
jgi:hypothetical protein